MFTKLYKIYTKLLTDYLWIYLVVLTLTIPLYPKFPFINIPGTHVAIRLEDFVLAVTFFTIFPYLIINFKKLFKYPLERAIILFLVVGLISLFSAVFVTKSVGVEIGLLHWSRRVEYLITFFLSISLFKLNPNRDYIRLFISLSSIVVLLVTLYGIGQRYFEFPVIVTQNYEYAKGLALLWIPGSHINSTFAGHYDLASYVVLILPTLTLLIFTSKKMIMKIFFTICFLAGLWLLANAVSRISIVSLMGALGIAFIITKKYKELLGVGLICIILFMMSSSLLGRYARIFEVVRIRLYDLTQIVDTNVYAQELPARRDIDNTPPPPSFEILEDRSSSIRFNVEWPRALRALVKNPLLGTGYSSITLATDNDYLRSLGETGLIGFAAFALVLIRIIRIQLFVFKERHKFKGIHIAFFAGVTGGISGILLNAVFIDVFEASKFAIIFWLIIGLYVATIRKYYNFTG